MGDVIVFVGNEEKEEETTAKGKEEQGRVTTPRLGVDIDKAIQLFLPRPRGDVDSPSGPDWELAMRLFVPRIWR